MNIALLATLALLPSSVIGACPAQRIVVALPGGTEATARSVTYDPAARRITPAYDNVVFCGDFEGPPIQKARKAASREMKRSIGRAG